jgi:hypothetical protein
MPTAFLTDLVEKSPCSIVIRAPVSVSGILAQGFSRISHQWVRNAG